MNPLRETPGEVEARMRATRASMRLHSQALAERARAAARPWPLWAVGAAAVTGLLAGRAGARRRAADARIVRATNGGALAGIVGLVASLARYAPLARTAIEAVRRGARP